MDAVDGIALLALQFGGQRQQDLQQDVGLGNAGRLIGGAVWLCHRFFQCIVHNQAHGDGVVHFCRDFFHIFGDVLIALLLFIRQEGDLHLAAVLYRLGVRCGVHVPAGLRKHLVQSAHHDVRAAGGHLHHGVGGALGQVGVAGLAFCGDFHLAGDRAHILGDHQIIDAGDEIFKLEGAVTLCGDLAELV